MRMPVRSTLAAAAAALVLSACQDATAPTDRSAAVGPESATLHRGRSTNDDVECRNMVLTGTFHHVYIPPGNSCWIRNAHVTGHVKGDRPLHVEIGTSTVEGNVLIRGGGMLHQYVILDHLIANGNVHVDERDGGGIWLGNSQVGGNVKMDKNVVTNFLHVAGSRIEHDLHLFHNRVASPGYLMANSNQVRQNLMVFHTDGNGAKVVVENEVGQNLLCHKNDAPFIGQPNVARKAHGQCEASTAGR